MLVQAEAVANPPCAEDDGIEEVFVRTIAVTKRLTGVEVEWYVYTFLSAALFEPEKLRCEVGKRSAEVFLSDKVLTSNDLRELDLHLNARFHAWYSLA